MKKILFIITQSELGGAQRWLFDTVTHLNKNQYEIVVAAGSSIANNYPLLNQLQNTDIASRKLTHLIREINPFKDLLSLIEIYRLIKKEQPDILQLCSTKAGLVGSIAGKLAGVPKIIYRIGGWSFNDPRPRWQNKIFFWLEKISAPLKDMIVVNSRHDYDQALQLKIAPQEKLTLIYNGIKLEDTKHNPKENQRSQQTKNEACLPAGRRKPSLSDYPKAKRSVESAGFPLVKIGCIANFYPAKGLIYLIESLNILDPEFRRRITLIIIGDGPQRPELESLIKKYNLENQIQLAGQKENPWQYFTEIGGIDLFIIPSVKEGMPYVLLEAMAAGLPIIATTVGAIPEIIQDKENGLLVPPKKPKAVAQAIANLIANPSLQEKISRQSLNDIQKYNLEKSLQEIIKLYH